MTNESIAIQEEQDSSLILKFRKPYVFEHETYTEIDLSGLERTTASDIAAVNKFLNKSGSVAPVPEMSMDFAIAMAARVCKKPMEFFQRLPAKEAIRLKNVVTGFLYGGDGEE